MTAFLALRWVDEGLLDEEALGRDLAGLHGAGAPGFGSTPHGGALRLGAAELPGGESEDWATFYARWRIAPLADQALERGALSREGRAAIERVCERMADLAGPPEDPARLHGDLWSGNVMGGTDGRPVLDRSRGLRRPPRGRPRDAAALRPDPRDDACGVPGARCRWPRATPTASSSTSCCRCWSTRCCSGALTEPAPRRRRAATPAAELPRPRARPRTRCRRTKRGGRSRRGRSARRADRPASPRAAAARARR